MNPVLLAAVGQMAPTTDAAHNRGEVTALAADASAEGVRLLVLPEEAMLVAGDIDASERADVVAREWPAFLAHLSELAMRHDLWIIAGGYEPSGSERPFNTLVVVNPRGELVDVYRKLHLYDAFTYRESDYVTAGQELPPLVLIDGVAVGLVNCYDLRFPELARDLVSRGADVLSVSAAWVAGHRKVEHWTTLLTARAIENTCWVLASGSSSPDCIGTSLVIDPLGVEQAHLPATGRAIGIVPVSLDRIAEVRDALPALSNRRLSAHLSLLD
ncbi:carbon-nitrogen hydrolase family protein [Microbacterium sp. P26]|uniref:carbon-nitrogen hydrolase family protein n=1 Tax=Microbacterium TaxID=33882 RepID=UPI00203A99F3|nr:carbon-nitrogen hydrolase family protein [Microbacterium sp. P26]MCM3500936.1 carbon-nitrogen hydrolase family protein [Microbacterium sp. P26]